MILQIGAGGANTDAHPRLLGYPHDIISFFKNPANSNFAEFLGLYQKGLSLREISEETGFPVSTIRDRLIANNIPLRANKKAIAKNPIRPKRAFWGAIPYGYAVLDGKVVVDPREIKIVRRILALHQKGMSFNATAIWLNNQKVPSKLGKQWSDKTIASIVRKHPSTNLEGETHG